jgi:hypothetical protein
VKLIECTKGVVNRETYYFQQPQQTHTWQQTQAQQLQGNSMASVAEPKLNVQNNNTIQVIQSRTSATPISTNTRQ